MARRGGFKGKWSAEQKRAIVAAGLDHEMSAREVWECATRGELPGIGREIPPFPIPRATVADLIGEERKRRRAMELASAAPDAVARAVALELGQMLARRTQVAMRLEARGKLDIADLGKLARASREVLALERDLAKAGSRSVPEGDKPAPEKARGFLDTLAAESP